MRLAAFEPYMHNSRRQKRTDTWGQVQVPDGGLATSPASLLIWLAHALATPRGAAPRREARGADFPDEELGR